MIVDGTAFPYANKKVSISPLGGDIDTFVVSVFSSFAAGKDGFCQLYTDLCRLNYYSKRAYFVNSIPLPQRRKLSIM